MSMGSMEMREDRIAGIQVQQSVQGTPIPIILGTQRVPGNLIGAYDFVAIEHHEEQGGKGGGIETVSYSYRAALLMSLAAGPIIDIGRVWRDKAVYASPADLGWEEVLGSYSQTAWGYLTTNHPTQALAYRGIAHVRASGYGLGKNASIGNHSFEVVGDLRVSGEDDCDPADVIDYLLTDTHQGAGFPGGALGDWSQYSDWCRAAGLLISIKLTQRQSAAQVIGDILQATNADILQSQGVLKILPRADQALTGNGVTYTPDNTPAYSIDDDDFLYTQGEMPVKVERITPADAYNAVKVEFEDRAADYNTSVVEAKDQAAIEMYGERAASTLNANFLCTKEAAQAAADALLRRHLYVRNKYRFKLGARYALLEPGDILQITESGLGMSVAPVRITEIDEGEALEFAVVAEDYPFEVGGHAIYPAQAGDGYRPEFNAAAPDCAAPVIFELPVEMTTSGLEVAIAVGSAADGWGGAHVWVSYDGDSYQQIATVRGNCRFGTLQATLGTSGSADVLLDAPGQILPGSAVDAQRLATLCWVGDETGGEFFAHEGATLTDANRYTLSDLVRGGYDSPVVSHASGQKFVRVDDQLARSGPLDASYVGRTIFIKLTSFNPYGGGEQGLDEVTATPYTITGVMLALPPEDVATISVVVLGYGVRFSWPAIGDADARDYVLRVGDVGTAWDEKALVDSTATLTYDWPMQVAGTYEVSIKARDTSGNESDNEVSVTVEIQAPVIADLSAAIAGPDVVLDWPNASGSFSIDRYRVFRGVTRETAVELPPRYASDFRQRVDWLGTMRYWVSALDVYTNEGAEVEVELLISAPAAVAVSVEVVDNNVLLRWADATTSLPIERYNVRRGASWETGADVGDNGNGRFAAIFEQSAGLYTYWVQAVDSAGNTSTPSQITASVAQPPDYILRADYNLDWSGTHSNTYTEAGALLAPVTSETWEAWWDANSWTTWQDAIDNAPGLYILPGATSGYYEQTIDYGTVIASTGIALSLTTTALAGDVTITPTISTREDPGDAWDDNVGQSQIVANNFRYIKVRLDFAASGGDDLVRIDNANVKLSTKVKNDGGSSSALAADSGGTTVNFNIAFIDVQSITVTPLATAARVAVYDFTDTPNPTSFKVLIFDTDGNRVDCDFSWQASGY